MRGQLRVLVFSKSVGWLRNIELSISLMSAEKDVSDSYNVEYCRVDAERDDTCELKFNERVIKDFEVKGRGFVMLTVRSKGEAGVEQVDRVQFAIKRRYEGQTYNDQKITFVVKS